MSRHPQECGDCAVGKVAFDSDTGARMVAAGEPVVLLLRDTSPEDVKGMHGVKGVLTQLGSMTSHAAVVARSWGKPCITGCSALKLNDSEQAAMLGSLRVHAGDVLSLNGSTGEVIRGAVPAVPARLQGNVHRFLSWVDEYRTLGVLANADTPADARLVRRPHNTVCMHGPWAFRRLTAAAPFAGSGERGRGHRARTHRAHVLLER